MKRHIPALLVISVLATACAAETVDLPPPPPVQLRSATSRLPSPTTPTEREREVAQLYAHAMASPTFAGLPETLADDVHFQFGDRDARGRERVVRDHQELFGAFDRRSFSVSRVWLTDSTQTINSQALEWTLSGAQARSWMGLPASNRTVVIHGLTLLWTDDDGIISEIHVYFDEDAVKAQLGGAAPPQAPAGAAGTPQIAQRGGTAEERANVAVARSALQALEDDKEATFVAAMADELEVVTAGRSETFHGKSGARSYFKETRKTIRQLDTVIQNAWGVGPFVVVEYALAGLQTASSRRPSGGGDGALHPLQVHCVDVDELRGGEISRIWRYVDRSPFGS